MERTVPSTASEEVELYLRTYYSLLRSSAEVQIRTLEEVHAGMHSLLHLGARDEKPDMSAFIYSILRLPREILDIQLIVLGQTSAVFQQGGYNDVEIWEPVSAAARRRRCMYDGNETLACYIASRSDIDDVIPLLTAFQIEWNKFHFYLQQLPDSISLDEVQADFSMQEALAEALMISWDDLQRLWAIWNDHFIENLNKMATRQLRFRVQLLSGSLSEYRRATNSWWYRIERSYSALVDQPVYFISSNPHSIANLLSGYAFRIKDQMIDYLERSDNPRLIKEWQDIQAGKVSSSYENFLYYFMKKYQNSPEGRKFLKEQDECEQSCGLVRIPSKHIFDVEAQALALNQLCPETIDPRLNDGQLDFLKDSDALILNIDYPLGLAAYNLLSKIAESVGQVLGVYAMGKAATLNAVIGDVMIPSVVHDEHSKNTFLFPNCFTAANVAPYLTYGTVLDNQKAVTVMGTFLQTPTYMDVFYREGYTDIEMESGPYLSAVYEMYRPTRHPVNEIVNLYGLSFDLGIIHYASDLPLGKGKNLGAGNLSYYGVDSTYAASLAILRRIFDRERKRLSRS